MPKRHWSDIVKDDRLIRNVILVILMMFIIIGLTMMYIKDDLTFEHYKTSMDIAMGMAIGTGLLKLLSKKT